MQSYLVFPESQRKRSPNPLKGFSLLGTEHLPNHFGPVAPVNIFLGENNSGKSRFMREVMRSKDLEIMHIESSLNLSSIFQNILKYFQDINYLKDFKLDVEHVGGHIAQDSRTKQIVDLLWKIDLDKVTYLEKHTINIGDIIVKSLDSYDAATINLLDSKRFLDNYIIEDVKKTLDNLKEKLHNIDRVYKIFAEFSPLGLLSSRLNTPYTGNAFFRIDNFQISFPDNKVKQIGQGPSDYVICNLPIKQIAIQIKLILSLCENYCHIIQERISSLHNPSVRTYIPTLRSARTLTGRNGSRLESDNDIFHHTTTRDYQLADTGVEVNTGFRLYDAIDTTRNARREGRNVFGEFEQFLSDTFFNHKKVEVVAERVRDAHGGSILVAVEGVEHEIHNLGDGIQAIIMLLYPLFIAAESAWFFIEEPETHLHPGFQRLFIETITTNDILLAKNLTIFLTTHSNHMLDFALEAERQVNIYTFRRRAGTGSKSTYEIQLSSPRDIQNLNALGVQNSSVFLANCSIWVEGITDRLYFRAYLNSYLDHLKAQPDNKQPISLLEGLHYAFLEYSGGNVSHYNFSELEGPFTPQLLDNIRALSIANRIMLVADQDAGKNTRHQARENQQHAGFTYHVLGCREVENLLSPKLIVKGLTKLFSQYTFDADLLKPNEYRQKYLGSYIRQQHPGVTIPTSFTADSGTIGSSYKRKFAEAVITPLPVWNDLSRAAQDFTKQLYSFIIAHNPRLGSN